MLEQDQDLIRARAHHIWEREGRPDGRHLEHWDMASAEIAAETTKPASLAKAQARKVAKTAEPVAVAQPRKSTARKAAVAA